MSKLLQQASAEIRKRHYARSTERSYIAWIKRYIIFHKKQHPALLGAADIEQFLTHLAVHKKVSASTQNQALNAIVFLYRNVLKLELTNFESFSRAKPREIIPVVFTQEEVAILFDKLFDEKLLAASLMYGSGLRLRECLTLRVKDIDLKNKRIFIRNSKGAKDRITILAPSCCSLLKEQFTKVGSLHKKDLQDGLGHVPLPNALYVKYPKASRELTWQYLFPSTKISKNETTKVLCRHHIAETSLQRVFKSALTSSRIEKHAGPHNLRHSFATHMLQSGCDVRTLQKLLGHKSLKTTSVYLQIAQDMTKLKSPLELLPKIESLKQNVERDTENTILTNQPSNESLTKLDSFSSIWQHLKSKLKNKTPRTRGKKGR